MTSRRGTIARALAAGCLLVALAVACGSAPTRSVTQVEPPTGRGTEPSAAAEGEIVETDRGAVVVDRPAEQTSAVGGTMAAIAKVITLPFTVILGIFDILF